MSKVCVYCAAYNHEKFIEDALKGFLSQKTNFEVKYVIHDDASSDRTAEIIKSYNEMYPGIFTVVCEQENLYSQNKKYSYMLLDKEDSQYYAICEGDDYWTDPYKLQKQVDYMDAHPECTLTMHNAQTLNIETHEFKDINPYKRSGELTTREVLIENGSLPPTASMVFRLNTLKGMPDFFQSAPVGDRPKRMYAAIKGSVYYFDECMSVYRINNPESFGGRADKDAIYRKHILDEMDVFFDKFNEYTNYQFNEEVQLMKSRELYTFYMRENETKKAIKTIYFKKQLPFSIKLKRYLKAYLPSFYIMLQNFYDSHL